jgi:hypothetical protein
MGKELGNFGRRSTLEDLLAVTLANPILFVTQVPVPGDFTTVASTFGNHPASAAEAPRGGEAFSPRK